jgi:hypothetical protein
MHDVIERMLDEVCSCSTSMVIGLYNIFVATRQLVFITVVVVQRNKHGDHPMPDVKHIQMNGLGASTLVDYHVA